MGGTVGTVGEQWGEQLGNRAAGLNLKHERFSHCRVDLRSQAVESTPLTSVLRTCTKQRSAQAAQCLSWRAQTPGQGPVDTDRVAAAHLQPLHPLLRRAPAKVGHSVDHGQSFQEALGFAAPDCRHGLGHWVDRHCGRGRTMLDSHQDIRQASGYGAGSGSGSGSRRACGMRWPTRGALGAVNH